MFLQSQPLKAAGNAVGETADALTGAFNSMASTVGNALPGVISAFVILFIGYIVAKIVKSALSRVLRAVKFNDVADKVGINSMLSKGGLKSDASGLMGKLGYWGYYAYSSYPFLQ